MCQLCKIRSEFEFFYNYLIGRYNIVVPSHQLFTMTNPMLFRFIHENFGFIKFSVRSHEPCTHFIELLDSSLGITESLFDALSLPERTELFHFICQLITITENYKIPNAFSYPHIRNYNVVGRRFTRKENKLGRFFKRVGVQVRHLPRRVTLFRRASSHEHRNSARMDQRPRRTTSRYDYGPASTNPLADYR